MSDKKEIKYIQNLFRKKFDLNLDKIPESNKPNEKSADLKLVIDNTIRFVCELKTLEYVDPSEEKGYIKGDMEGEFWKNGNAAACKIARLIEHDHKQLSSYTCPKGFIFLNEAFDISEQDYYITMRGYLPFADKASGKIVKEHWWHQISDGKIKDIKKQIDFYIWINRKQNNQDQIFFDETTKLGKKVVEKYFVQHPICDYVHF